MSAKGGLRGVGGLLGRQVELVILDDASSQEQVVTDYNNLISSNSINRGSRSDRRHVPYFEYALSR